MRSSCLPRINKCLLALVNATLMRALLSMNPLFIVRTVDKTMISFSPPWNASTVEICTPLSFPEERAPRYSVSLSACSLSEELWKGWIEQTGFLESSNSCICRLHNVMIPISDDGILSCNRLSIICAATPTSTSFQKELLRGCLCSCIPAVF